MGDVAGPFYFAWAEASETTFGPEHYRMDEYIFSAQRVLAEGQKPTLTIVIENPHVGILSPDREYWAWFAWDNGSYIEPLFFGRVLGIPSSIFGETLEINLVSDPVDYAKQVQRVAESLKIAPFYSKVFIDVAKRDDPDTILEANTKLYGVNPTTLVVTADDWINGDDGNIDFTEDDHFYDSMNQVISQPPKTVLIMDASVNWTQTARGNIDIGNRTYVSYSGDGIISEWPKPLQSLGGGYTVAYSNAVDARNIANALTASFSWSWTNTQKEHNDGDSLSASLNVTVPQVTGLEGILTQKSQSGVLDPFAVDKDGDPAPLNIPASSEITRVYCPAWSVKTSLVLHYEAERTRTERLIFKLEADLQPVLVDPDVAQVSEVITRSGADVGVPIVDLLNWTTVSGQAVSVGQVIFPNDPSVPGAQVAQVCVIAGTAGTEEPEFSEIIGDTVVDGTVTWASLGTSSPTSSARDWTPVSHVPLGTIILPRYQFVVDRSTLTQSGLAQFPVTGVSISTGQIVRTSNGSYQVCTLSGETISANAPEPAFSTTWGVVTNDGTVEWTSLGTHLPDGTSFFIATTAGVTGPEYVIPPFDNTLHATTTDGTVVWTSIGSGVIPAGGTPGNVSTPVYFSTDNGKRDLEYLACILRSKLLWYSRCVGTTFDCEYSRGVAVTPRKTATLHDPRISGGLLLGKVKTATLVVDGGGESVCHVELASTVGYGNAITEVPGTTTYVRDGYVRNGYVRRNSVVQLVPTLSDLAYTPVSGDPSDDGLRFPLTKDQILVVDEVHGDLNAQEGGIRSAFASMARVAQITQQHPQNFTQSILQQTQVAMENANSVAANLKRNPIWQEYVFKPVNSGPFNNLYRVPFQKLVVPQQADLQAETTT